MEIPRLNLIMRIEWDFKQGILDFTGTVRLYEVKRPLLRGIFKNWDPGPYIKRLPSLNEPTHHTTSLIKEHGYHLL